MDWFENWFDSFYYHKLYRHRDMAEAQFFIDNIIQFIQPSPKARIMDLACGKGRHSIYLNSKGFNVVGVDLSKNSILEANKSKNANLHFYEMDMRALTCDEPFDLILNMFTSFGYFKNKSENLEVLQGVNSILQPNGIVVIDFLNASTVINKLVSEEVKEIDQIHFTINRKVENNTIVKSIEVKDETKSFHFEERVSALELQDFEEMFKATGFELLHSFGNYKLDPFDKNTSDRLILMAKKTV